MKYFLKKIERSGILRLDDESLASWLALLYDNDAVKEIYQLLKKPKHNLYFWKEFEDGEEDGEVEIDEEGVCDLYLSLLRRKKRFDEFFRVFEPLYRKRLISMLFATLTTPYTLQEIKRDENLEQLLRLKWKVFWKAYRQRLKRHAGYVHGYLKLADVGAEGQKLHWHIAIAIPRIKVKKIPDWMKPDERLWEWRTGVEFIRKSVKGYLANYLGKPMFDLPRGWRSYEIRIYYSSLSIYSVNDTKKITKK